jgi:hypothetical protein
VVCVGQGQFDFLDIIVRAYMCMFVKDTLRTKVTTLISQKRRLCSYLGDFGELWGDVGGFIAIVGWHSTRALIILRSPCSLVSCPSLGSFSSKAFFLRCSTCEAWPRAACTASCGRRRLKGEGESEGYMRSKHDEITHHGCFTVIVAHTM